MLVDESQFLTREQVHALSEVVDNLDIPVLCYGLRTDFRGVVCRQPIFARWSDKLVELKTICFCGRKASMVLRLDQSGKPFADGEQVVIGVMSAMSPCAVNIIKKRSPWVLWLCFRMKTANSLA